MKTTEVQPLNYQKVTFLLQYSLHKERDLKLLFLYGDTNNLRHMEFFFSSKNLVLLLKDTNIELSHFTFLKL